MSDPLPELSLWKLTLNGQTAGFLNSVAVPTDNSIVTGFGLVVGDLLSGWAFQEMQGQRIMMPGSLITLDTSLRAIYCDVWDSGFVQQAEISAFDASQSGLASLTLNLQVTNLREAPLPTPGASSAALFSRAIPRKSQLTQRLLGRTLRSSAPPPHTSRSDPLPAFAFKIAVSGSSTYNFVSKLGALTYSSGVIAPFVITMTENVAADFRAWKQAGGQRDVTIQYLDTALRLVLTIVYGGCTIAQIVPAVPISVLGPTSVTLNVSRLTITY